MWKTILARLSQILHVAARGDELLNETLFPSLAHVEKYGTGYREIPVIWNPSI